MHLLGQRVDACQDLPFHVIKQNKLWRGLSRWSYEFGCLLSVAGCFRSELTRLLLCKLFLYINIQMWLSCPFALIFLFPVTNLITDHTRYNGIYPVLLRIFTVTSSFNILRTILVYCATGKQSDRLPDKEYVLLLVRNIINSMPPTTNFLVLVYTEILHCICFLNFCG